LIFPFYFVINFRQQAFFWVEWTVSTVAHIVIELTRRIEVKNGRMRKARRHIFLARWFAGSQLQVREPELKKHFVKVNSGLVRKLPAAGCFNHTVRNAWSRCREENSRGDFESDKLFALRAERGQRWRPAIQVASVCGWEEISSCFEYKTKMLIGCGKG
jgi:hypothetical protein